MLRIVPALLLLIASSCSRKSTELPRPAAPVVPPAVATDTLKQRSYLALGDSYTIGQGVGEIERFPYLLAAGLRDSGYRVAPLQYIARTGWTTDELQGAITATTGLGTFDLVTLLVGVNDQYRGRDTASYAPRFTQLLQTAIGLAGGRKERVFVLSIPDYSATPYVPAADKARVRAEIDLFNSVNRNITLAFGVSYTDITPGTRLAAGNGALLAPDGLHYSAIEHARWAGLLLPKTAPALR